ncbi:MAG: SdpI family protein [Candidatus Shapirobacteria bacterium]
MLTVVMFWLIPALFYSWFPASMVTHWDFFGQPNGYSSQNFALFFMPALTTFLLFLFLLLPKIDPYHANFKQFFLYYYRFVAVICFFLFYLYLLTLIWNLGYSFNFIQFFIPAFGFLFYFVGYLLEHTRPNWFVGIRTPWTMSNPVVWKRTHSLGARLFKSSSLIMFGGLIFPGAGLLFVLIPILTVSLYLYLYSFWIYSHLKHGNN